MNCQDNSRLKVPLPEVCKTTDIGCVPITDGKPECPPEADQLPFAYDINSKTLWIFSCESREWTPFTKSTLAELDEVSLDNIKNICSLVNVPVFYNLGYGTTEGSMPLGEFTKKIVECGGGAPAPTPSVDSKTVVAPGENVTVTSATVGDTTTYTVNASVPPSTDSKTVVVPGENVTVTSATVGDTTSYTVNAVIPTPSVDKNDITVVEAGSNVSVTSSKVGDTTIYTVSATGGGGGATEPIHYVTTSTYYPSLGRIGITERTQPNVAIFVNLDGGGENDIYLAQGATAFHEDNHNYPEGGVVNKEKTKITNPFDHPVLATINYEFVFGLKGVELSSGSSEINNTTLELLFLATYSPHTIADIFTRYPYYYSNIEGNYYKSILLPVTTQGLLGDASTAGGRDWRMPMTTAHLTWTYTIPASQNRDVYLYRAMILRTSDQLTSIAYYYSYNHTVTLFPNPLVVTQGPGDGI